MYLLPYASASNMLTFPNVVTITKGTEHWEEKRHKTSWGNVRKEKKGHHMGF
jgi:hypothetical protein